MIGIHDYFTLVAIDESGFSRHDIPFDDGHCRMILHIFTSRRLLGFTAQPQGIAA